MDNDRHTTCTYLSDDYSTCNGDGDWLLCPVRVAAIKAELDTIKAELDTIKAKLATIIAPVRTQSSPSTK